MALGTSSRRGRNARHGVEEHHAAAAAAPPPSLQRILAFCTEGHAADIALLDLQRARVGSRSATGVEQQHGTPPRTPPALIPQRSPAGPKATLVTRSP